MRLDTAELSIVPFLMNPVFIPHAMVKVSPEGVKVVRSCVVVKWQLQRKDVGTEERSGHRQVSRFKEETGVDAVSPHFASVT